MGEKKRQKLQDWTDADLRLLEDLILDEQLRFGRFKVYELSLQAVRTLRVEKEREG